MAEPTASNTSTETKIRNTNRIILKPIGKRVPALRHRAHKHADRLLRSQTRDVVLDAHDLAVEAERDLAAVVRQVVRDGVLDHFQQFLLRGRAPDARPVQQLHHQPREALEGARDADRGRDFDQHAFRRRDVDLQLAGFVDGGVEEG